MSHILIVDDNPNDRLLARRQLEQKIPGTRITEIINTQQLEQAIAQNNFDLVITDYRLFWITGLDILRIVKSRYPKCPVIMFTNTGNEEVAVEAMKAGLDDYIIKSSRHYVRLVTAVRSVLERSTAQRQVTQLESRLQRLLNQLNVGVFRATPAGLVTESNQALLQLLGQNDNQPINLRERLWGSADLSQLQTQAQEILLNPGSTHPRWVLLTQYVNVENNETVVDGIVEDITRLKQAELALRQLNETLEVRVSERTAQLEEVNTQLEAFAYSVSHDLRAPLRAVESFSQILQVDYEDQLDDRGKDYLNRIIGATALMNSQIENLLDYSRLSLANLSIAPTNLGIIFAESLAQLSTEIQEKQAEIIMPESLPTVLAHPDTLMRAIVNLLLNAIKFVAPGVQPQIRIWAEEIKEPAENSAFNSLSEPLHQTTTLVRLWIEDNGIGIDEEYYQQIFNVFERLHGVEAYPGIGVGLAIARKGIERMGGRIGVTSTPGQGSQFWITLRKYEP